MFFEATREMKFVAPQNLHTHKLPLTSKTPPQHLQFKVSAIKFTSHTYLINITKQLSYLNNIIYINILNIRYGDLYMFNSQSPQITSVRALDLHYFLNHLMQESALFGVCRSVINFFAVSSRNDESAVLKRS